MRGGSTSAVGIVDTCRDCHARLARGGRTTDGELVARSRSAVSQSFAALARVPDLSLAGQFAGGRRTAAGGQDAAGSASWSPRAWMGLEVRSDLRFFFDVDDGEVLRRDATGVVLASEDDVPRETRSLLTDLAYATVPEGRPRLFTARVRNRGGTCVYEGSMRMDPVPAVNRDRRREA